MLFQSTTMYYSLANGGPVTVYVHTHYKRTRLIPAQCMGMDSSRLLHTRTETSLSDRRSPILIALDGQCVATSLAEIVSVFPCAGGVYYQTFMLSPPSYRKIVSWICGWAFFVGNGQYIICVYCRADV